MCLVKFFKLMNVLGGERLVEQEEGANIYLWSSPHRQRYSSWTLESHREDTEAVNPRLAVGTQSGGLGSSVRHGFRNLKPALLYPKGHEGQGCSLCYVMDCMLPEGRNCVHCWSPPGSW